eukprot:5537893-Pleurochrysis_carterae.AAC.1
MLRIASLRENLGLIVYENEGDCGPKEARVQSEVDGLHSREPRLCMRQGEPAIGIGSIYRCFSSTRLSKLSTVQIG